METLKKLGKYFANPAEGKTPEETTLAKTAPDQLLHSFPGLESLPCLAPMNTTPANLLDPKTLRTAVEAIKSGQRGDSSEGAMKIRNAQRKALKKEIAAEESKHKDNKESEEERHLLVLHELAQREAWLNERVPADKKVKLFLRLAENTEKLLDPMGVRAKNAAKRARNAKEQEEFMADTRAEQDARRAMRSLRTERVLKRSRTNGMEIPTLEEAGEQSVEAPDEQESVEAPVAAESDDSSDDEGPAKVETL